MRFLHGLTTVDVNKLALGQQAWGAILSPKGRVLSVVQIEACESELRLHLEGSLVEKTQAILDRYAVMDEVTFAVETGSAYRVWTSPADVWKAPMIRAALPSAAASVDEVERLRVAAGFLRYGIDVGEEQFPFETPLTQFLDYDKGCYVGQEPVFRVHAQGNAARTLRGMRFAAGTDIAVGTRLVHPAKSDAGPVTSIATDRDGSILAMGYLHRTAWTIGETVTIASGAGATISDFPIQ